ncbi:MAG: GTP cyclohydrolase II RibA, partial [Pseudomonadota bacterium]
GIGLLNKIKAYRLQDQGADTVEANKQLGFDADLREYDICKQMLDHLQVTRIKLMTNNPKKIESIRELGIDIVERVEHQLGENPHNVEYLNTKVEKMGHLLDSQPE